MSRVYVKPIGEYGYALRPMLGFANSEVVQSDDGRLLGFAGTKVATDIVDPTTGRDGLNNTYPLPLDFRVVGISIMTAKGIPTQTQGIMFENFMRFPRQQRQAYVEQFEAIDSNDPVAVDAFVNAMLAILT